jgi:hypothetical protein
VTGSCERGDEPSASGATELVIGQLHFLLNPKGLIVLLIRFQSFKAKESGLHRTEHLRSGYLLFTPITHYSALLPPT